MAIQVGDKVPNVRLQTMTANGQRAISMDEILNGQKVVLFAVPGAFTSTCSNDHLPSFVKRADDIKAKGVDVIACVAVNDASVMHAWGNARGVGDKILMLADGNGDFAKAMGQELDGRAFGMGIRSQRYAAIIEDGVLKALHVDAPGEVNASGADAILAEL
jgi:peroxiredoxin